MTVSTSVDEDESNPFERCSFSIFILSLVVEEEGTLVKVDDTSSAIDLHTNTKCY